MKIINIALRIFSILTLAAAVILQVFLQRSGPEYMGSTISVIISSITIYIVTYIPNMLEKKNIKITKTLYTIILASIVFSMGGGFMFRLYEVFNYYDTVIHFINGGILVIIVFVITTFLSEDSKKYVLPIIIISLLAAISLGTLWEIYEFLVDVLFDNSNMQRFMDVRTQIPHIGQAALKDTMIDLIVDTLGAVLGGLILYIDSINKGKFIDMILLTRTEKLESI